MKSIILRVVKRLLYKTFNLIYYLIKSTVKLLNIYRPESPFIRCVHNKDLDNNFDELVFAYQSCQNYLNSDERVILGTPQKPIDLGITKIKIEIPIIFHLLDPKLSNTVEYWSKFIKDNIIEQLNHDYNVTFDNYQSQYIETINNLFRYADPSKKEFYLRLSETLPKNLNLEWKFTLKQVIIKPTKLKMNPGKNKKIFKSTRVKNPDQFLNIIIVPSQNILGISVFPFNDRSDVNVSKINPKYRYRNAILISTIAFEGKTKPFDKFRTFTHEIGHWCGLLHPFDNLTYKTGNIVKYELDKLDFTKSKSSELIKQTFVGDLIADTAVQYKPTYGTVYDKINYNTPEREDAVCINPVRDTPYASIFEKNDETPNFLNYMDYTDDDQMCMFTQLQMLHMIYMLTRFRPHFIKEE